MSTWTMPHRALQIVFTLIVLAAATSFALGIVNAPQRGGRLPGEKARPGDPAPIAATEATPLSEERIEGPPQPPELTPEEKAKLEAEKKAKAEEEAARKAEEAAAGNMAPLGNAAAPPAPAVAQPPPLETPSLPADEPAY